MTVSEVKRMSNPAVCAVLSLLLLFAVACEKPAPTVFPPVPVEVAQVKSADVPIKLRSVGTVESRQSVAVSSQVGGFLQDVLLEDGQPVKEGQVLFRIDSRKFEVAVRQAEAALEQVKVQWRNAVKEAQRAESLLKDGVTTPQEHERLSAAADALQAAIKVQEAVLENARLDLAYCTIRAPLSGRAGVLNVHKGDLIKAGTSILVTISQMNPVHVKFSIPEKNLGELRAAANAGELVVEAVMPGDGADAAQGRLVFVDNTVDVQTGSIILKAEFANESEKLWPGTYVETTLVLGTLRNALLVPSAAVQSSQQGSSVFVIDSQNRAIFRSVTAVFDTDGHTVVSEGLKDGETVVTDGQLRLGDGMKVSIRNAPGKAGEKSE